MLQPDDLLLTIDGIPVENDGTVLMDDNLKTSFPTMMQLKNNGDTLSLTFMRNGRRYEVAHSIRYHRTNTRLVDKIDLEPRYYIEGGFVFTTPSYYYFKGDAYWAYRNPLLSYYYYGRVLSSDSTEEVVMLSSVLPDKSNVGYHDVSNEVIKKINGQPVRNFAGLIRAFKENRDSQCVIEDADGNKYVLPTRQLDLVNEEIMKRYGISQKMRL